jgi:undecaprenyl pyrophosphate synthase
MMKMKRTTADVKIAGAVAMNLLNAKVRREVERALEAYPDANQLILNIALKYTDRVLMQ